MALQNDIDVMVEVVDSKHSPSLQYVEHHYRAVFPIFFPSESNIFNVRPSPSKSSEYLERALQDNEITDLNNGSANFAVFGQFKYMDQFEEHWTKFCYWKTYESSGTSVNSVFTSRACTDWNSVGDGALPALR